MKNNTDIDKRNYYPCRKYLRKTNKLNFFRDGFSVIGKQPNNENNNADADEKVSRRFRPTENKRQNYQRNRYDNFNAAVNRKRDDTDNSFWKSGN